MSGPLRGVRVLDFTVNLPGPYATCTLLGLGAEVVKVEPPRGDPARHMPELFGQLNRGKRCVALDLTEPEHLELAWKLVDWADVLVEGFRPGVMAKLGLGAQAVRARRPELIYCSISAFGQDGPRAAEPGHDLNLQALAGLCHLERDSDGPRATVLPIADLSTSLSAVTAICAALLARERDGGCVLDVAMADTVAAWTQLWDRGVDLVGQARSALPAAAQVAAGGLLERLDRERLYAMPHYGLFRARDGWIALGVVDERHFWEGLCTALHLGPARRLPLQARTALGPVLRRWIAQVCRLRSRRSLLARLREAGVPATAVHTPAEAMRDPQLRRRSLYGPSGALRPPVAGARPPEGAIPPRPGSPEAFVEALIHGPDAPRSGSA